MDRKPQHEQSGEESGFVMVAMLAVAVPMVLLVGAAASTMLNRNEKLQRAMREERAFLAAESGVDAAIYRARASVLDARATFAADVADGMRYEATPTQWLTDGIDNDGDGSVDEADEDIVQVTVEGTCRGVSRRLTATFVVGRMRTPPLTIPSPIYIDPTLKVKLKIKSKADDAGILVSGLDANLDGSRPANPIDVPAITVATDELVDKLTGKLKQPELLEGYGLIEVRTTELDVHGIADHAEGTANYYTSKKTFPTVFGDSSKGDFRTTFCDSKADLKHDHRGAGLLVIDGELKASEGFRFDGLIIVRGKLELKKDAQINGAVLVLGKKLKNGTWQKADVKLSDSTNVQYSSEALNLVANLLPTSLRPVPRVGDGQGLSYGTWSARYALSGNARTPNH